MKDDKLLAVKKCLARYKIAYPRTMVRVVRETLWRHVKGVMSKRCFVVVSPLGQSIYIYLVTTLLYSSLKSHIYHIIPLDSCVEICLING